MNPARNTNPLSVWLFSAAYVITALLTILLFDGTADAGDSIQHYLFARYAPSHPALFFDHWAKPLFVLLSSPFAQAGFNGIKAFNALVALITMLLVYRTARSFSWPCPIVASVILMFTPLYYIQTFSGLTEPLFALVLMWGIFLAVRKKLYVSALIVSFLPMIRSEGLLMLPVFMGYLMYYRSWRAVPLLLAGQLLFAIAGSFVHGSPLWVITHIPYNNLGSPYGSGDIFHYGFQLFNASGPAVFLLICTGLLYMARDLFGKDPLKPEKLLILSAFSVFFIAHSLFWGLGIFNSMGLRRVLVCILPLLALAALRGFHLAAFVVPAGRVWRTSLAAALMLWVVVFPFTSNPYAVNWKKNMVLQPEQLLARDVADYVRKEVPLTGRIYYEHPYLGVVLNIDPFEVKTRSNLSRGSLEYIQPGDIVIWDDWFSVVERGVDTAYLDSLSGLTMLKQFSALEGKRNIRFRIYRQMTTFADRL